jgi:hypothetical protein
LTRPGARQKRATIWGFKFSTPVLLIVIGGALLASVLLGFHRHDE